MAYRRARYPPVSGEPVSGKPAWPGENAGVGQPPELRSPDAVPGVTVLLRDRRQRQVTGDAELRLPVFSVTKMFLATAALRLCETGHLSLDEQVRQRVPQAPASITVREVLGHTAGLPDYAMALSYTAAVAARPLEPGGLTEILAAGRAGIQPRRGDFGYSNTGYWLLGAVLEDAGWHVTERDPERDRVRAGRHGIDLLPPGGSRGDGGRPRRALGRPGGRRVVHGGRPGPLPGCLVQRLAGFRSLAGGHDRRHPG